MRLDLELLIWLLGTAVLLCPVLLLLHKRDHSWPYLAFFFVLAVYLSIVARETLVYHALPGNIWSESGSPSLGLYVNLLPGSPGPGPFSSFDMTQVVINGLLGAPLGFGLNFVRLVRLRTLPWVALGFGLTIESLQLISSLIAGYPRHIADVNDLLLNAFGVALGYALFRGFAWTFSHFFSRQAPRPGGLLAFIAQATARAGHARPR